MNTVVIPQKMSLKGDLVVMPRSDYEALFSVSAQAKSDWIYEKDISKYVHSRIKNAESEFKKGKSLKWNIRK